MIRVSVDPAPIELGTEIANLGEDGVGAIATFTGVVRADDGVTALELEHYPGMTEAALCDLAERAMARWSLASAVIVHRVGPMMPGDRVVFIATAASHRHAALEACAYLIDRLKTDAPFWKREQLEGATRWVDARQGDGEAAARWTDQDAAPA
jgi:molybdopterin synthase catalytic subunit